MIYMLLCVCDRASVWEHRTRTRNLMMRIKMWMLAASQSCHVDLYLIHLYLAFSLCSLYIYIYTFLA